MAEKVFVEPNSTKATLSRIAKDASVSMSTVSKVLNGRSGVSDATRHRVEELLQDLDYNRRGTETSKGSLIEVVFEAIDSGWALELIEGVERVAQANGLSVVLTVSSEKHAVGREWMEGVIQRRPIGVILVFSALTADQKKQLRTRNIPFVMVDPAGDPPPDVPSVGSANWSGGFAATKHLTDQGHTRIAMISGPDDLMCSRARVSGYRSAMDSAGLPVDTASILEGDFSREKGIELATVLLGGATPPTAIFAGNDLQALGVYEAARTLGLSIPHDLAVVGYDDLQVAGWVSPPLTTVRQPIREMAEEAARLILKLRAHASTDSLRFDLATSLIVRGSTQAPSIPAA
jgi:LacI family xylobiose transport system transcriptional regulator